MNKLFLRISLGILAAIGLVHVLHYYNVRAHYDEAARQLAPSRLRAGILLSREKLDDARPQDRAAVVEELSAYFDHPIALLPSDSSELPAEVRAPQTRPEPFALGDKHTRVVYVPLGERTHYLVLGPLQSVPPPSPLRMLLALVLILGIVGVVGFLLASPMARSLKRLEDTVHRIGEGELEARVDGRCTGPVGQLGRAFNAMADKTQAMLDDQRQLLQAVAHELRTPTARIRFALAMLDRDLDDAEWDQRLEAIDGDLGELDELVTELLSYNRFASGAGEQERRTQPCLPLVEDLVEQAGEHAEALQIELRAAESAGLEAFVERRSFRRAIRNLLGNARRYAERHIVVELSETPDALRVEVRDDGPGVPEADRAHILKPFARADDSRSRDSGGTGLGLSIVARIMELHGGSLEVGDAPEGGACFATIWPKSA